MSSLLLASREDNIVLPHSSLYALQDLSGEDGQVADFGELLFWEVSISSRLPLKYC